MNAWKWHRPDPPDSLSHPRPLSDEEAVLLEKLMRMIAQ